MNSPRFAVVITFLVGFLTLAHAAETEASLIKRYLAYRKLPRLTADQIDIVDSVKMMCRDPRDMYGPHLKPGIHLYASPAAVAEKRKGEAQPHYPLGTLFVKEKFETKNSSSPDVITVMEKIANDGTVNDWRFTMIRLSDRSIVRDGFRVSCTQCHTHYKTTDFVTYETDMILTEFAKTDKPVSPRKTK